MFAKLKNSAKAFVNFFIGDASIEQSENAEPDLVIAAPKEIQEKAEITEKAKITEKAETTDGFPYYIDQKTTNTLYSLNTVYAALKLLNRNVVTYQLDSRFKTAPTIMRLFRSRKIFEVLHGTDVLLLKTNKELSEILKAQGLPYSGKKEVLIQRIAENADISELDLTPRYSLTDYGKEFKKSVFNRLHAAYCDLFVDCYNLIYNGQIAEAFTTIAKYECTKFYKRGLTWNGQGLDWVKIAKEGLPPSKRDFYNKYMDIKKQSNEHIDACITILSDFLGEKPSVIESQYTLLINAEYPRKYNNGIIHSDIVYDRSRTEKDLESYRRCRIKKYSIHSVLDIRTCKTCAQMDLKVFNVSDAQIGENCPPFHPGCRCWIGSASTAEEDSHMQRAARDQNNKSILVPATTDYKAWAKEYAPQKYKEYFEDEVKEFD